MRILQDKLRHCLQKGECFVYNLGAEMAEIQRGGKGVISFFLNNILYINR